MLPSDVNCESLLLLSRRKMTSPEKKQTNESDSLMASEKYVPFLKKNGRYILCKAFK
jgi:hypothetical protein